MCVGSGHGCCMLQGLLEGMVQSMVQGMVGGMVGGRSCYLYLRHHQRLRRPSPSRSPSACGTCSGQDTCAAWYLISTGRVPHKYG